MSELVRDEQDLSKEHHPPPADPAHPLQSNGGGTVQDSGSSVTSDSPPPGGSALSPSPSVSSSDASLHTVSSHFEGDIEHVDPFMFGYPTPSFRLTPQEPVFVKQQDVALITQRISHRPAIHIRTRSLGIPTTGFYWPSMQTPPPQTPLPPIPTSAPAIISPPAACGLVSEATDVLTRSSLESTISSTNDTLADIAEESASSLSSAFSSSFLNFDSSSQRSSRSRSNSEAEPDEDDQPVAGMEHMVYTTSSFSCSSLLEQTSQAKRVGNRRLRKLSRLSIRRKKETPSLKVSRMPSFRRNVSEDSNASSACEEIRTPVDAVTPFSPTVQKHHRGHSWSRIKERIKKEVFDQ